VKAQILDVIEVEGPIHVERLVRIVARRFGLNAVRQARAAEIAKLIPRAQLRRSKRFGDFAWPFSIDPATWTAFRCEGDSPQRTLHEIAPEEIINAMEAVRDNVPDLDGMNDLIRRTAEQFGVSRLGPNVRARLEAVYKELDRQLRAAERAAAGQTGLEQFNSQPGQAAYLSKGNKGLFAVVVGDQVLELRSVSDGALVDQRNIGNWQSALGRGTLVPFEPIGAVADESRTDGL
jgi:hypothetical protein